MNMTISKKQTALYHKHGFDAQKWDALIEEGNAIRKEIKAVAEAYDVEWDEVQEEGGKTVATALKKERDKQKGNDKDGKKKDDDDDGDD
jgi:Cys-tRNA synthase (O-phospho-L-seryl-tRNA:Cys-tRNA synthase)